MQFGVISFDVYIPFICKCRHSMWLSDYCDVWEENARYHERNRERSKHIYRQASHYIIFLKIYFFVCGQCENIAVSIQVIAALQ